MLAIEEAKLPPPKPAVAAATRNSEYGVPGWVTHQVISATGTSSSAPDTAVQLRPPNRATAAVYGMRMNEPTRFGTATSQNSWSTEKWKPAAGRLTVTALHSSQIEK